MRQEVEIKEIPLKEAAEITMGTSPKGETYNKEGDGLPLLNGPTEFGVISPSCTLFTIDSKRECKPGDLLFCVRGSTTGRMNWADQTYSIGRGICAIRGASPLETKFIRYCIEGKLKQLLVKAGGSTFKNLTSGDIKNFKIPFPESRYKIAAVLSAYDDLIENNTRRMEILEEMARQLYREWFVRFRFPGHEDVDWQDSELGEIPVGWEVKKLGDVIEFAYGKGLRKKDRKSGPYPVYGSSGIVDWHEDYIVEGPGIIVGRKGNVGSVFWSDKSFCPIDTTFYVKTDLSLYYVFHNLLNQHFPQTATAVPGVNRNHAYMNKFLVPSEKLFELFDEIVIPIFESIRLLERKNKILRETRDLLIPRLISGEIEV